MDVRRSTGNNKKSGVFQASLEVWKITALFITDLVKQVSIIACKPFIHEVLHENWTFTRSRFRVPGAAFKG